MSLCAKRDKTGEIQAMSTALKTSSDRSFGLVFTTFFAIVGFIPLVHGNTPRLWSLAVAIIFLLFSLIKPELLAPLNRGWTRFGLRLNLPISTQGKCVWCPSIS